MEGAGEKMANSCQGAICVSPLLLVLALCGLVWNEQHAVCMEGAINQASEAAVEIGCDDIRVRDGHLVILRCDIDKSKLEPISAAGAFSDLSVVGTGLDTTSEMLQCIEEEHTHKEKVNGQETTIRTYTYSFGWRSHYVDDSEYQIGSDEWSQGCGGVRNPPWPDPVPYGGAKYAPKLPVGSFTTGLVTHVPLDTLVDWPAPEGWRRQDDWYVSSMFTMGINDIGKVRVRFQTNNWEKRLVTVLGENDNGRIEEWTAEGSWLCSDQGIEDLRMGSYNKQRLFRTMHEENTMTCRILRVVFWATLWIGFALCFAPLQTATGLVPCVGGCLESIVEDITCIIACVPATSCCMVVVGVCWFAFHPLMSLGLLLIATVLIVMLWPKTKAAKGGELKEPLVASSKGGASASAKDAAGGASAKDAAGGASAKAAAGGASAKAKAVAPK